MRNVDVYNHVVSVLKNGVFRINGDEAVMPCPSCGDENGHFSVNINNGRYNCFKCSDIGGNLSAMISKNLREWKSLTRTHSISTNSRKTISFTSLRGKPVYDTLFGYDVTKTYLPENHTSCSLAMVKLAQKAYDYCMSRGMVPDQIRQYRVSVIEYDPRVYFTYWEGDKVTYWMGRSLIDDENIKTVEPPDSVKPLFGRHIKILKDTVALVEGVFDHFATPDSYSIMGSGITDEQIKILKKDKISRVILIGDPDADEQMHHNAKKLNSARIKTCRISLLGNKDPSSIGIEMMEKILKDTRISNWNLPRRVVVDSSILRTDTLGQKAAYRRIY